MARNFYRIFTENNPVMGDSKTFGIPEAKGLKTYNYMQLAKVYIYVGNPTVSASSARFNPHFVSCNEPQGKLTGYILDKCWMNKETFTRAGLEPATSGLTCRCSTN